MARGQPRQNGIVLLQNRIRKATRGNPQQKKKFAGPKKNIQQAAALKITDVFGMQSHVQRSRRAFLDERPQGRKIKRQAPRFLAPGIDALQIFVAEFDEVVQAKILLSK